MSLMNHIGIFLLLYLLFGLLFIYFYNTDRGFFKPNFNTYEEALEEGLFQALQLIQTT